MYSKLTLRNPHPNKQQSKKTPMTESILVKLLAATLDLLKEDFVLGSY